MATAQKEKEEQKITNADIKKFVPVLARKNEFANLSAHEQKLALAQLSNLQNQKVGNVQAVQKNNDELKPEHAIAAVAGGAALAVGTAATLAITGISAPIIGAGLVAAGAGIAVGGVLYSLRSGET